MSASVLRFRLVRVRFGNKPQDLDKVTHMINLVETTLLVREARL
jgi:hypothetical protein